MKKAFLLFAILTLALCLGLLPALATETGDPQTGVTLTGVTLTSTPEGSDPTAPQIGNALTAAPVPEGAPGVTFAWYATDTAPTVPPTGTANGKSATYTVGQKDLGKYITVVATQAAGAAGEGSTETVVFVSSSAAVAAQQLTAVEAELNIAAETLTVSNVTGTLYHRVTSAKDMTAATQPKLGAWKALKPVTVGGAVYDLSKLIKNNRLILELAASATPDEAAPDKLAIAGKILYIDARPGKAVKPAIGAFTEDTQANPEQLVSTGLNVTLTGLQATYEYKFSSGNEWTPVPEGANSATVPIGFTAAELWIRERANPELDGATFETAAKPGGPTLKFKVPAVTKAPVAKLDYVKGTVKAGGDKWEYQENNVALSSSAKQFTIVGADTAASLTEGTIRLGGQLMYRLKGTAKKPPSLWVTVRVGNENALIGSGALTLTGESFAVVSGKLVNSAGTMVTEYLMAGKWKKGVPKLSDVEASQSVDVGIPIRVQGNKDLQFFADPAQQRVLWNNNGVLSLGGGTDSEGGVITGSPPLTAIQTPAPA
jgi:hypothetical protein